MTPNTKPLSLFQVCCLKLNEQQAVTFLPPDCFVWPGQSWRVGLVLPEVPAGLPGGLTQRTGGLGHPSSAETRQGREKTEEREIRDRAVIPQ